MRQNPHVRICGGPGSATTPGLPDLKEWSAATPAWGGDLLLVRLRAAHGTTVFPGGAGGNGPA